MSPLTVSRLRAPASALVAASLALAGVALVATPAQAASQTFIVDSLTDDGVGNTLREAIALANANNGGIDTIDINVPGTITLTAGAITITDGVTIAGNGSGTTLTRSASQGIFIVDLSAVTLATDRFLTVLDVDFVGAAPLTGRAIDVLNTVPIDSISLVRSTFTNFDGALEGGALYVPSATGTVGLVLTEFVDNDSTAQAGAVFVAGAPGGVFVSGSNFVGNSATNGGALVASNSGPVTIMNSTFALNTSPNAGAGAFLSGNTSVSVFSSDFTQNSSSNNRGGALYIGDAASGTVVEDSLFDRNTADIDGGAMHIAGGGGVIVERTIFSDNGTANGNGGAINFFDAGTVQIEESLFELNGSEGRGGALNFEQLNGGVDINTSEFDDNDADTHGGAIAVDVLDRLVAVRNSTFTANSTFVPASGTYGGAIYANEITSAGTLRVDSSTFSGNRIDAGTLGNGGGTSVAVTTLRTGGRLTAINSTFNEDQSGNPGAIFAETAEANSVLEVLNSTIVASGSLRIRTSAGTYFVRNSIIEGDILNVGNDAFQVSFGTAVISVRNSLVSGPLTPDFTDDGGNQLSVADMQLGALANNGGPTQTMLPAATSPAINAGDPAFVAPPSVDQRGTGFARVVNGRIDVGAVELQTLALAATGLETSPAVPIGAASLLLLGAAALLYARRRRTA